MKPRAQDRGEHEMVLCLLADQQKAVLDALKPWIMWPEMAEREVTEMHIVLRTQKRSENA